jgi:hypothetical protein
LGISTLRDRVCMTAAMLVLEPIFEADLLALRAVLMMRVRPHARLSG